MKSYLDDPREFSSRFEYPTTIGGAAEMAQWQATLIDLSDMTEEEYMKPMTVIVAGFSYSSDTKEIKEEKVNIYMSIIDRDGNVLSEENFLGAGTEESTGTWRVKWQWIGNFVGSIKVAANVITNDGTRFVTAELTDNVEKKHIEELDDLDEDEDIVSVESYGVGSVDEESETISAKTYTETIDNLETKYIYTVSKSEYVIYLKLSYYIDNQLQYSINTLKYGDEIPSFSGSTSISGYTFDGWKNSDGTPNEMTTMPSKNLNLYGEFKANEYVLSFFNDNNLISSANVAYGASIPAFPVMEDSANTNGDIFKFEWDSTEYSGATMPYNNLNIRGEYKLSVTNEKIYYKALLNGVLTDEDKSNMSYITLNDAKDTECEFIVHLSADTYCVEQSQDDEWVDNEYDNYIATHLYPTCIFLPKNTLNNYNMTIKTNNMEVVFNKVGNVVINTKEYDQYNYGTAFMHADVTDQEWNYSIELISK